MTCLKIAYNNAYSIVMNYRRSKNATLMFLNDYVNNVTILFVLTIFSYNILYTNEYNYRVIH